jgi:hypothetical protein
MNLAAADATARPEKIRGWLYLPAFGLVVGCIINAIMLCAGSVAFYYPSERAGLTGRELVAAYVVLKLCVMAFFVYATVRFFGKKRNAPAAMVSLLIAQIAAYGLLTAMFLEFQDPDNQLPLTGIILYEFAGGIVAAVVWIPYFRVAERVKRTFVS